MYKDNLAIDEAANFPVSPKKRDSVSELHRSCTGNFVSLCQVQMCSVVHQYRCRKPQVGFIAALEFMLRVPAYLRHCLPQSCRPACNYNHVQSLNSRSFSRAIALRGSLSTGKGVESTVNISSASPGKRRSDLEERGFLDYPRADSELPVAITSLAKWRDILTPGQEADASEKATVVGRVCATRSAGSKLLFVDLTDNSNHTTLQVVVDKAKLSPSSTDDGNPVKRFGKLIQRGDSISVCGVPYRTSAGELSLRATDIPRLLSPCLHQMPTTPVGEDSDFAQDRHVHMLTDPSVTRTIIARSEIVSTMHSYFSAKQFVNVQTPILAASAGGATARSFETSATEFASRKLSLRIAPELWLKRLVVGGLPRVFEIGPSFRNEGLDKTHNPEFTTCEFYAVNWNLSKLQSETQRLITAIANKLAESQTHVSTTIDKLAKSQIDEAKHNESQKWTEIDFIPALNRALEVTLPNLSSPTARRDLLTIFKAKHLTVPSTPTLPRLLDKLSSVYLEPSCQDPTWIINTPECLSPLAKSFAHPDLPDQRVAARAELFMRTKEVVNCYEEENSPHEQRRKFIEQQLYAHLDDNQGQEKGGFDREAMEIDEDYLRALEWGLPPTGGWGCGIDRLCMLLLEKDRISDVLTFGNLRMVTRGAERKADTGA